MNYCSVFKRYELKYLLTTEQYLRIMQLTDKYMYKDRYGESDVNNVYYDTPDYLLIRRSIEKPIYKEKLRVRCYGVAVDDSEVFVELKKKFDSVVYKRRIQSKESEIEEILSGNGGKTQIGREIDYFVNHYKGLSPKMVISYRRRAFYGKDDADLRITFDSEILWRNYDLSLKSGIYGNKLLPEGKILMEIKSAHSFPLWLARFLSAENIYNTSFSKYGSAYIQFIKNTRQGDKKVA